MENMYDLGLETNVANYTPLTPITFLQRTALAHPDRCAVIHGPVRRTWSETYARCLRMASALTQLGVGKGDTVAVLLPNLPEMLELHFAVPMVGAVLNTQNTRLDAHTMTFMLNHGRAKVLFTDREFSDRVREALAGCETPPIVIDVDDPQYEGGELLGKMTYEALLDSGSLDFQWQWPEDEWQAIALNYTSGTTGKPKGVVYHHRGAYLNALSNVIGFGLPAGAVYLWTLPMFHCNGWCYPWAVTAVAGTHVCLRAPHPGPIFDALVEYGVTHFCAAPIILNMMINAPDQQKRQFDQLVTAATGGAAPPAATIEAMEAMGMKVVHLYGLTETYGPSLVCEFQDEWHQLSLKDKAAKMARQGVLSLSMSDMMVADPVTLKPVARDGNSIGELLVRGNSVMKGYLKNPEETRKAFEGGWFHTGDLGVWHPDGYVEIKDRSKDIIISGGENISTLEVESVLYDHPAVLEAAVVAAKDDHWGEIPCAFITLKNGQEYTTEDDIIAHCRASLAGYKTPKRVLFVDALPKTSTGKLQKHILREELNA
ncbi:MULTISPECIES: AMP-binding protein [unclassified Marinobacter]|uniref:AMP-binding protein n=1 Tax=unclassified Marinobacter TaxID=83889 RepID=UPI000BF89F22|nr:MULTISPECIES: AMP-binding protein [unclassified Marinobacter]PFG09182.1 fatty-acyl-CoA synthase [Marinobacter sp. LV10MA510-1]PFG51113.1 fatty-acyl-CoA synthase [Marinobacter sp. LV10R520-4]